MGMFGIILIVTLLLSRANRDSKFWIIAWPGTAMHELMHWAVGSVTNGKPTKLSVLPQPAENGQLILGYVNFANITWYNAFPIAVAPLLAIPAVYYASQYVPHELTLATGLAIWALASSISQCLPSTQDWEIARRHPVGLVFWTSFLVLLLYKNNNFFG